MHWTRRHLVSFCSLRSRDESSQFCVFVLTSLRNAVADDRNCDECGVDAGAGEAVFGGERSLALLDCDHFAAAVDDSADDAEENNREEREAAAANSTAIETAHCEELKRESARCVACRIESIKLLRRCPDQLLLIAGCCLLFDC